MPAGVQLAQLYIGACVVGGVLAIVALLLGSFGRRAGEPFTPRAWVCALSSALVMGGTLGLYGVLQWPSDGQGASLPPALAAAALGALLGWSLQHWAQRSRAAGPGPGAPAPTAAPAEPPGQVAPEQDRP